jgi:hypothetical protein
MRDFGSIDLTPVPALDHAVGRQPSWLIAMRARVRRSSLDAALASGADPCGSRPLAHRAARLTSGRTRHKMANRVAEILATPSRPPRGFSVAVEPDRGEIATAEPLLLRVWELVRSSAPVYARGMAMLEDLLGDGASPLYLPVMRGQLSRQLELIIAALEGSQYPGPLPLDPDDPGNWG